MDKSGLREANELLNKVREACGDAVITEEEILMMLNNANPNTNRMEMLEKLIEEKRLMLDKAEKHLNQMDALIAKIKDEP